MMTNQLRKKNSWLRPLLIVGAVALTYCGIGLPSVFAAATPDLPQLRMDRFSLENRVANLRGKHPFLSDTNSLRELRDAEKSALIFSEARSSYQTARSQIYELMLPAFPALNAMATARPPLEDERFRISASGSPAEQEVQLGSLQLRLDSFETNAFYVSDWCQLDLLTLCSAVDPKVGKALPEARRQALMHITNGASPALIKTALEAAQLETEAGDLVLKMQDLNHALAKIAVSASDRAPSDNAQHASTRMQSATSSVQLSQRLVLFPATELMASTADDALLAVPAYLSKWEARTNALPAQEADLVAANSSLGNAGKFLRRWGIRVAIVAILIAIGSALVKKITAQREQRKQAIQPKKVFSDVLGEDVPSDEQKKAAAPPGKTAKECFAQGFVGTGMEILEQAVKDDPKNFDRRIELARAHFQYCHNPRRAVQIVRELLESSYFSTEQEEKARAILKEWE